MNKAHTLTYSENKNLFTYNIFDSLSVDVQVTSNPYQLPLDFLFGMAARKNKKRGFLFVSKILGKHVPVKPVTALLSGALLGIRMMEEVYGKTVPLKEETVAALLTGRGEEEVYRRLLAEPFRLPEETLFIGFAETATALGQSVFDLFDHAHYIHTTREQVRELVSVIDFEEEHSHATAQSLYARKDLFKKEGPLVLVDDEITTGKTAINIIEAIHQEYPHQEYIVVSLLDWRSAEDKQRYKELERRLGIRVKTAALLTGDITVTGVPVEKEQEPPAGCGTEGSPSIRHVSLDRLAKQYMNQAGYSSVNSAGEINRTPYGALTGRFDGISPEQRTAINEFAASAGSMLEKFRSGGKALCLGTGEFMYLPMKIAEQMGEDLVYQSTTRSPIHRVRTEGYAVISGAAFESPDDPLIQNFFYNIDNQGYEEIFLFLERSVPECNLLPLLDALKRIGPSNIFVITVNEGEEEKDNEAE